MTGVGYDGVGYNGSRICISCVCWVSVGLSGPGWGCLSVGYIYSLQPSKRGAVAVEIGAAQTTPVKTSSRPYYIRQGRKTSKQVAVRVLMICENRSMLRCGGFLLGTRPPLSMP